ncbi:MAG: 50S ribosomal protein L5 [Chlorobi bacterium OLB5]|nr:MAG: 50S ribosomal protein L5 [Chlorobi bacterium OLB5]
MANEKKEKKAPKTEKTEELKGKKSTKKSEPKEDFVEEKVPVRLRDYYKSDIVKGLSGKFGYKNPFQVPKLQKISINVGVGAATQDPKIVEVIVKELENIAGQKPVVTKAKKSVSNFKLREGMKIGAKVTLRKARMYEFLDKLINIAIPRIRDFRGVPDKSFDGNGNYTLGVKEHVIFPEINIDAVQKHFGMDITFVTSANSDDEARELLRAFGMPFVKREASVN